MLQQLYPFQMYIRPMSDALGNIGLSVTTAISPSEKGGNTKQPNLADSKFLTRFLTVKMKAECPQLA